MSSIYLCIINTSLTGCVWQIEFNAFPFVFVNRKIDVVLWPTTSPAEAAAFADAAGSGNVPWPGDYRHAHDHPGDGTGKDRVSGGVELDEVRQCPAGSGHRSRTGQVSQGSAACARVEGQIRSVHAGLFAEGMCFVTVLCLPF